MAIGLVGETLIADGIFCVLAARRPAQRALVPRHVAAAAARLDARLHPRRLRRGLQAWRVVGEDGMPYVWLYESEQMFRLRLTPRFAFTDPLD